MIKVENHTLLQTLMKESQAHTSRARNRMLRAPFTSRSMQVPQCGHLNFLLPPSL
jgi:hypothetical protein